MKRKLMAMTLALMMVLTVAISVSAATVTGGGTYEGYGYETIDTCNTKSFSSMTIYDSMDYKVYSDVSLNSVAIGENGSSQVVTFMTVHGDPNYYSSITSGESKVPLDSIHCVHYVNGEKVCTAKVYPG